MPQRNSSFVARLTTAPLDGRKKRVWHVLEAAQSVAEAKQAMADLDLQRRQSVLVARGAALRVRWRYVDFDRHLVAIGADGQASH